MRKASFGWDDFDSFGDEPYEETVEQKALVDFERQAHGHSQTVLLDSKMMRDHAVLDAVNHRYQYIAPHKAWYLWVGKPKAEAVRLGVKAYRGLVGRRNLTDVSLHALHNVPLWVGTSDGEAVRVPNPVDKTAAAPPKYKNPAGVQNLLNALGKQPGVKVKLMSGSSIQVAIPANPLLEFCWVMGLSTAKPWFFFELKNGMRGVDWSMYAGVPFGSKVPGFQSSVSPIKMDALLDPIVADRYVEYSLIGAGKDVGWVWDMLPGKKSVRRIPYEEYQKRLQTPLVDTNPNPQGRQLVVDHIETALQGMSTKAGGRFRRVESYEPEDPYWTAEPTNRQRLDHYVGGGWVDEGGDADGWQEKYAGPLRKEVLEKLESRFGKGMLHVDVDEKGFVYVQLTPKGKEAVGVGKKTASLASKIAREYAQSRGYITK